MYYYARYNDPAIGRFRSADTIIPGSPPLTVWPSDATAQGMWRSAGSGLVNPQDLNRYAYALNNPLTYTDPTGHLPLLPVLIAGGPALRKAIDDGWTAWDTDYPSLYPYLQIGTCSAHTSQPFYLHLSAALSAITRTIWVPGGFWSGVRDCRFDNDSVISPVIDAGTTFQRYPHPALPLHHPNVTLH